MIILNLLLGSLAIFLIVLSNKCEVKKPNQDTPQFSASITSFLFWGSIKKKNLKDNFFIK